MTMIVYNVIFDPEYMYTGIQSTKSDVLFIF